MIISDEEVCLIPNLKPMLLLRKPCQFLSFCLIYFEFLLQHCFRYKRTSVEKGVFEKGQERAAIFQGGARAPLAPIPSYPTVFSNFFMPYFDSPIFTDTYLVRQFIITCSNSAMEQPVKYF